MFSKVVILYALAAVSHAGVLVAPAHYSSAAAVSSQNIVRHDEGHAASLVGPIAKVAFAAPAYHAASAPISYATPVSYAASAPIAYHAPIAKVLAHHEDQEIAYPKYEYNYSVADGHSGDNKFQQEFRDGDVVKGSYSFHEADGSIRTVEYSADDHNGFNAVVHNSAPTALNHVIKSVPVTQYYQH